MLMGRKSILAFLASCASPLNEFSIIRIADEAYRKRTQGIPGRSSLESSMTRSLNFFPSSAGCALIPRI